MVLGTYVLSRRPDHSHYKDLRVVFSLGARDLAASAADLPFACARFALLRTQVRIKSERAPHVPLRLHGRVFESRRTDPDDFIEPPKS